MRHVFFIKPIDFFYFLSPKWTHRLSDWRGLYLVHLSSCCSSAFKVQGTSSTSTRVVNNFRAIPGHLFILISSNISGNGFTRKSVNGTCDVGNDPVRRKIRYHLSKRIRFTNSEGFTIVICYYFKALVSYVVCRTASRRSVARCKTYSRAIIISLH